ncbi:MAG: four helix bundle protein [Candidatus Omnitrophota bacterium]
MKITRFEDLDVWKESRVLVNMVYDLTSKTLFQKDFGLKEQIQRASVSCMLNVSEGFDSGTNPQFIQHLIYVRRSSSEVQSILYVALDRKYISLKEFESVFERAKNVGKLSNGFIRYLKNSALNKQQDKKQDNRLTG